MVKDYALFKSQYFKHLSLIEFSNLKDIKTRLNKTWPDREECIKDMDKLERLLSRGYTIEDIKIIKDDQYVFVLSREQAARLLYGE